jgi:hypothetical protein
MHVSSAPLGAVTLASSRPRAPLTLTVNMHGRLTSCPFVWRLCIVNFFASPNGEPIKTLNGESGICSSLNLIDTWYSPGSGHT